MLQLSDLLKDHAIALRLEAGSEEAGYLAQIFPLPRTPTVVVIKNGELKEYVTPGATKEDFLRRIQNVFNSAPHSAGSVVAQSTTTSTNATQSEPAAVPTPAQSPPVSEQAPSTTTSSESVRRILAARAARLQAQKEQAEIRAKEERAKRAEKVKAEAEAGMNTDNAKAHRQAEAFKKRRQQEEEERQRILKRIEDDKAERKLRAAEREQQRVDSLKGGDVAASLTNAPTSKLHMTSKASGMTALQVRLFDGSTLRSRFESKSPLKDIRKWVDDNRTDGAQPYKFKQVLTPLPNKNIDDTEESQAIGELGLSPSSTLVLIPVAKYSSAYGEPSQGIFSRIISFIMSIFAWFLGFFRSSGPQHTGQVSGSEAHGSSREQSRVGGAQNTRNQQRDQQLYNGNSVSHSLMPA